MKITTARLKEMIKEEADALNESARDMEILTTTVKSMAASRGPEVVANLLREIAQDELEKLLKKKDTKDQMGEIVKKIMKKLYKDLSLEHPYIIDRIKI
jgi:hypothetical protein